MILLRQIFLESKIFIQIFVLFTFSYLEISLDVRENIGKKLTNYKDEPRAYKIISSHTNSIYENRM